MMKILFLFLFFSLNAIAIDFHKEEIQLPLDLDGVKGNGLISLEYKRYNQYIKPSANSKTDIISFFENLFFIYKNRDQKALLNLFEESTKASIKLDKRFNTQFDVMALIEKPKLLSIQKFNEGLLARWNDKSFSNERKIFLIQKNGKYLIKRLNIKKDNEFFWNSNLFFQYNSFKQNKPKVLAAFKEIKDTDIKKLKLKLSKGMSYINMFQALEKNVNLVAIDNYKSEKYPFKDHDDRLEFVELKFSGKNFRKTKEYKIYIIESTYPIGKINDNHFLNSSSFVLEKK